MTIKEAIEKLKKCPRDAMLMVDRGESFDGIPEPPEEAIEIREVYLDKYGYIESKEGTFTVKKVILVSYRDGEAKAEKGKKG